LLSESGDRSKQSKHSSKIVKTAEIRTVFDSYKILNLPLYVFELQKNQTNVRKQFFFMWKSLNPEL